MLSPVWKLLADEYGSRRAAATHLTWRGLLASGLVTRRPAIDWRRVERFVFVCAGNICRSPLAAAQARALGLAAISVGLQCAPGQCADRRAIEVARRFNLDLRDHRSTPIHELIGTSADLVVGMEPAHLKWARSHLHGQKALLGLWLEPAWAHIHDPYCSSAVYFARCAQRIVDAVKTMAHEASA